MKKDPIILTVDCTDLQRIVDILLNKNRCDYVVVKDGFKNSFSLYSYVVEGHVLEDEQ